MRLLHTSDWHLGRSLHRADLSAGHEAFVDHLVETVRAERIDAVLIAGDVFDRAIPPLAAVALYETALARLRAAGARVVVTSGNHDSAARLGVNSGLIDAAGVHVRTRVAALADPVLLSDAHGPVAVYAIPYLEPETVRGRLPGEPVLGTGHAAVLGQATAAARADLAVRGVRGVAVAHGWVTGGAASESERDITVGGIGDVSASLFDGFAYSALGHLHRPQTVREGLRYSGSPLPLSFSEAGTAKSSWLVDLDASGLARVEAVLTPVFRPLSLVRGSLEELLTSREHDAVEGHFLAATLTDPVQPVEAMARIRVRFPHVLRLQHEPAAAGGEQLTYAARVSGRTDLEIATGFVSHVRGVDPAEAETALLVGALDEARLAESETERVA